MDNKFKVFVVAAFILLFAGMTVGGYFIVQNISDRTPTVQMEKSDRNPEDVEVFELSSDITTNLISEKDIKQKHIIKITVGIGIDKKSKDFKTVVKNLAEKEILIRDEIIQVLRDQPFEKMAQADAQKELAELITSRISTLLFTQSIEDIYFGEFFVQ